MMDKLKIAHIGTGRRGSGTYLLSDGEITVASELMSLVNAVRNDTEPEYGAYNGRKDREIDVAMARSWANNGAPVTFPFEYDKR